MVASTVITPANGARLYIGPAADTPPTQTAAAALTYVPVRKTETFGDFGDSAQAVTFTSTDDQRVTKVKGALDAGDMTVTVGYLAGDPGQQAMDAAETSSHNFVFKITLNDTPVGGTAPTTTYLWGMVTSNRRQYGAANNVIRIQYSIALNAAPIEVQAS